MSEVLESVLLLERFRSGDEAAATRLYERYVSRLESLVRSRLSKSLARRFDAEDVVQSVYRSFFVRARSGQFEVDQPGELWSLLAHIAINKLCRSAEWHSAAKRTPRREAAESSPASEIVDRGTSPELAVIIDDELAFLMSQLPVATCRILELRLQGCDVEEISELIGRSPRTVRRQLESIRETLLKQMERGSVSAADREPRPRDLGNEEQPVVTSDAHGDRKAKQCSIGEFVLRRQIGIGLTGRVYEAFDKHQQQLVAVKVLRKAWLADRTLRQQFEAEADLIAQLDHPGIVRTFGHGQTPNRGWFLVMELLSNGDLSKRAGLALPVEQAVDWIRQVAEAVRFAHQQGIIHCDLKPANLMLTSDGRVVVTDFGFARTIESSTDRTRILAGTPAFMAPEQIDSRWGDIGPRTDIYGLGAVLYFLLTGQPPISARRTEDALKEVASPTESPLLNTLRPDIPASLADLCRCCLSKSPSSRFQNIGQLIEAIRRLG